MKLNGVLDYSMGGFLCLRGYALFKELSDASIPLENTQRELIETHKDEIAEFLSAGEYRFFPEVVLSLSLDTENNFDAVDNFFKAVQTGEKWSQKLGDYNISIFNHDSGGKAKITNIEFDDKYIKLNRIDGNHRLSAADSTASSFKIPYCIILFRNKEEEKNYSRAIFHNINSKQKPLKFEENLKVILEAPSVFSDEKLKTDSSFGWEYYFARKCALQINFMNYPFISSLIQGYEYTFLVEEFKLLLKNGYLHKDDSSVSIFVAQIAIIEQALKNCYSSILPQNIAVMGALAYYKFVDAPKYSHFIDWIKENCITEAPNIHISDLIEIFDKVYDNSPKTIFMSMKFGDETADTFQTVKDVRDIIKRENGLNIKIIKVDEHGEGSSGEIYQRIVEGIKQATLIIADLSLGNKNVHHEIGYAQGLDKKVLLLYQNRTGIDANLDIGSNLCMHDQLRFNNQTDLRPKLLKRVREYFGIEVSE